MTYRMPTVVSTLMDNAVNVRDFTLACRFSQTLDSRLDHHIFVGFAILTTCDATWSVGRHQNDLHDARGIDMRIGPTLTAAGRQARACLPSGTSYCKAVHRVCSRLNLPLSRLELPVPLNFSISSF